MLRLRLDYNRPISVKVTDRKNIGPLLFMFFQQSIITMCVKRSRLVFTRKRKCEAFLNGSVA